jgi:hypothetical protein
MDRERAMSTSGGTRRSSFLGAALSARATTAALEQRLAATRAQAQSLLNRIQATENYDERRPLARQLDEMEYQATRLAYHLDRARSGENPSYPRPNLAALHSAQTTADVQSWLNSSFPGTHFYLGGAHVYAAKQLAMEATRLAHAYPTFMRRVSVIGDVGNKAARAEVTRLGGDLSLAKGRGVVASTLRLDTTGSSREAANNGYAILLRGPGLFGNRVSVLQHPTAGDRIMGSASMRDARDPARASQVAYTLRHEFGHVVHFDLRAANWDDRGSFFGRAYGRMLSHDPGPGARGRISPYAASSDDKMVGANEQYAEAFAAARYGRASVRNDPFVTEIEHRLRDIERI